MTEKLSECCGADVVKEWDVPGAVSSRIPNLYCTVCGKPCTIASQPENQQYVIGFLFNYCAETVLLINKNRPAWQKGKLNGVGGHVEKGESPADAMEREFKEEAGLVLEWEYFCTMVFPDCEVHCYRHIDKSGHQIEVEPQTDEYLYWYSYRDLPGNIIPNLNWLIPMALQKEEYMTSVITRLEAV